MGLIAEGKYRAKVVEHSQVTENENSGNEEVRALCEILEEGEFKGQARTWYGYFTEATAERTIESLRHMGWKGDDITAIKLEPGVEFQIVIKHEESLKEPGKMRDRIAFINRLASVYVGQPMSDTKKADFAKRMKGLVLATKSGERSSPNGGPKSAGDPAGFPYGANAPQQKAGNVKL